MPRYDYDRHEIRALVEWHMADQEAKAEAWDSAVLAYNANKRDGITGEVAADEAISRNLAYETSNALASTLVPRSPELKITPKRKDLSTAAEGQEGLISETFRQADAEGVMRKGVALSAIQDYAIIKTVWKGRKRRPHYRAIPAKNVFFDLNAEEWDEIAYVGEITVRTLPEIKARAKRRKPGPDGKKIPHYKRSVVDQLGGSNTVPAWLKTAGMDDKTSMTLSEALKQYVVVELIMFDRIGDTRPRLLHVIPGIEEPLLDIEFPHLYMENPYSFLTLEVALEGLAGSSPYKLVRNLGIALNQMESLRMATAKAAIPTPILNKNALKNPDDFMAAFRDTSDPNDIVEIELVGNVPISDVLTFSQTPGTIIDFSQAINAIETIIQSTLGLPSYLRGGNSGAEFATEIQLQSHELATLAGARKKVINAVLVDMGVKALQLYAERLDHEDVVFARAADGEQPRTIDREIAALNLFNERAGETPLEMDYTVRVVDEASQNPVVRLQALQPFLPLLLEIGKSGGVDLPPIIMQVLRWLGLEKAIPDNPVSMQQQQIAAGVAGENADVPGVSGAQQVAPAPRPLPTAPELK